MLCAVALVRVTENSLCPSLDKLSSLAKVGLVMTHNKPTPTALTSPQSSTADLYRSTYHRDGTVTYWSCYQQAWRRQAASRISDDDLCSMSATDRRRVHRTVLKGSI